VSKVGRTGSIRQARTVTIKSLDDRSLRASTARAEPVPWRFSTRGVALRLFFTCWIVFTLLFATNTVREIYPALSLGDRLSFDVAEYLEFHPDIFEMPGRGVFINNNPGASILGAIPYALSRPVVDRIVERAQSARTGSAAPEYNSIYPMAREFYDKAYQRGLDVKFGLAAGVMQAFLMAPLSALSAVVMFFILVRLTSSVRTALLLALLYAFATPVLYRTAQLNQNILVSHVALFAFAVLWRPWDEATRPGRPRYLLAGLLIGWAVVLDYSGLVVVLVMGLYAIVRQMSLTPELRSRADLPQLALGVLCSGSVLLAYQWLAFGNPILPAQSYMPPTHLTPYGFRGMSLPQLDLLWETAFSMRFGLFTSAPLLLLALFPTGWLRRTRLVGDREFWFIVAFSVAFFLFCAANQYGRMQFNSGVRHVVPVIPFLFLLAAGVLVRVPAIWAVVIGILATYWSVSLAMYRDVEQGLGILDSLIFVTFEGFRLPWQMTLDRLGYFQGGTSPLPILLLTGVVLWAVWSVGARSAEPTERPMTVANASN
jgi:hypothetical protein